MSTTQLSLMDLYKIGSHRGNKASKLNPKLKKYVYGTQQGMSLIDLALMQQKLENVENFLKQLGKTNKQVIVVGTSTHVKSVTEKIAKEMGRGMPFVSNRWLGGTLTNWSTVKKTLKTLEKNESIIANEKFFKELSRNEQLILMRETEKLRKIFGGLVDLKSNRPGALVVLDASENVVAIKEADLMNVPVIALTNTGALDLPTKLDYTVVCNTNSTKLLAVVTDRLVNAYGSGIEESLKAIENEKKN
jgi:small subunit ribosomal protein S2